jgi:hypothetical protein
MADDFLNDSRGMSLYLTLDGAKKLFYNRSTKFMITTVPYNVFISFEVRLLYILTINTGIFN